MFIICSKGRQFSTLNKEIVYINLFWCFRSYESTNRQKHTTAVLDFINQSNLNCGALLTACRNSSYTFSLSKPSLWSMQICKTIFHAINIRKRCNINSHSKKVQLEHSLESSTILICNVNLRASQGMGWSVPYNTTQNNTMQHSAIEHITTHCHILQSSMLQCMHRSKMGHENVKLRSLIVRYQCKTLKK